MKITRVEIYPVTIPYQRSGREKKEGDRKGGHVVLKVFTDEGVIGLGEAATGAGTTVSMQARQIAELQHYFAPRLIGQDPFNLENVLVRFDMKSTVVKHQLSPTAIGAVFDALYDIMGKVANVPVYNLLGGAVRKTFGLTRTVYRAAPADMAEEAVKLKELGYKMITVQVGENPQLDIQRVAHVRKAVGDHPIEVEAAGAYTADVAIRTIKKMEEYGIEAVEQPCAARDLDGMAEVARAVDTPVVIDDGAVTLNDVMEIIRKRAADIICLKPAKSGGLYISKKMAAVAEAGEMSCSAGSRHPFGIGAAVIHHLVASTPNLRPPIGYGSPLERFVDDIIVDPITVKNGEVRVPEGPGLGVELDEAKLKRYTNAPVIVVSE
jgi:L-alanine-DL-glutamate epimerase-like enolase superfamily enzyme